MVSTHLPAWCEQQSAPGPDGRYVVACYFTRDGHPVAKWRAERVQLSEYAPDGTLLRVEEGVVNDRRREEAVVFSASSLHFSH